MTLEIEGYKELEQVLGAWSPNDLAYIERIDLRTTEDGISSTAYIQALCQPRGNGWPDLGKIFFRVGLIFDDVSNLSLQSFGAGPTQIAGFAIEDIRENHWERIRFAVEDYEEGKIEFYCRRIRIDSALPAVVRL